MRTKMDEYDNEPEAAYEARHAGFDSLIVAAHRGIDPQRLEKRVAELIEQDALANENAQLKRQLRALTKAWLGNSPQSQGSKTNEPD